MLLVQVILSNRILLKLELNVYSLLSYSTIILHNGLKHTVHNNGYINIIV